ncbi:hypothetical protein SXCC_00772 [Gluconacetobacter sp. SXCC-1]|nr:hypothetical protein SXCC_00772 [Gluconacetobacter sp. SXCC-1]
MATSRRPGSGLGRMAVLIMAGHIMNRLVVAHSLLWFHSIGAAHRLKCHTAYRAFAGMRFPDVRMHRTAPNGTRCGRMLTVHLLFS